MSWVVDTEAGSPLADAWTGQNGGPQKLCPLLDPGTSKEKGLCRWDQVQDLKMRSSRIAWVGPNSSDRCPYEREKTQAAGEGHVATEAGLG